MDAERHVGVDPQPSAGRFVGCHAALRLAEIGEDANATLIKERAFGRELETARRAVDQPRSQPVLQAGNELADRRRGHAERPRRRRKAAAIDDLGKYLHLAGPVDLAQAHCDFNSQVMF